MRRLILSVLILAGMALPANAIAPCCGVTAVDAKTGVVTARVTATGQIFTFKAPGALLQTLKPGSPVYANFAAKQVSLNGSTACCSITGMSTAAPAANQAATATSKQLQPSAPTAMSAPAPSASVGATSAASAASAGFKCDDNGICYCTGGPQSADCKALGGSPSCGHKLGCDGIGRCYCTPSIATRW